MAWSFKKLFGKEGAESEATPAEKAEQSRGGEVQQQESVKGGHSEGPCCGSCS